MHVVIVESPAKSKTIHKYLGKDYQVLASYGHVRDLPAKDGSVLPDDDFAMTYEELPDAKKNIAAIAKAVKSADSLILATDPDREGEAISWHILEALKKRKSLPKSVEVQRISFSSITKKAIQDAIAQPRTLDMDLVNAQQARRALDYLVGFTLSPVLWRKLPGSRSAGRVQSVALRLICDREQEIEDFVTQEYWSIEGAFTNKDNAPFTAKLTHFNGEKLDKFAIPDEKQATAITAQLEKAQYHIATVEKKQTKRNPYAPFTTSTLQQEASRKLGFGAKRTMMLAQKLYEGVDLGGETVGLITYMRTDGIDVAPEAIAASRNLIERDFGKNYLPEKPRMYRNKAANAQEAHEAIRPTDPMRTPKAVASYLDKDALALYTLIWKRLIASQMASVVLDQVAADIETDDKKAILRATGSTIAFDGFYRLYNESRDDGKAAEEGEDSGLLPALTEGDAVTRKTITPNQHFTEPPPRYSEASLVKKLEELGIGRPSTYASIISILQDRNYVTLDKKRFIPEPRGRVVVAFLTNFFNRYVEYDFTANLEGELDQISAGELEWKKVLEAFWGDFFTNVEEAQKLEVTQVIRQLNQSLEHFLFPGEGTIEERRACPSCADGRLSLKMGKFGAFLGCSNYPDCRFTRQLSGDARTEDGEAAAQLTEPRVLGENDEGEAVTVRKGPYGFYVQLGEGEKPKRTSIPKNMNPLELTLEQALALLSLPREIGKHPETGKKITAGIGRFGPYLRHDSGFTSLKEDDVLTVGLNRAVTLIAEAAKNKGKGGKRAAAKPLRVLGKHPDDEQEIALFDGRYGPYVKHGKINASLPKSADHEAFTLEEAVDLLNKKKSGKAKKPAAKKKAKK